MTTTYGRTRSALRRWPANVRARAALETYFDSLPPDPAAERTTASLLNGWALDFRGADLSGLDLLGAELSEANLSGVRVAAVDLYTAWLSDATLDDADLTGSDLRKVQGRGCRAPRAVFRDADMQRAEFDASNFQEAIRTTTWVEVNAKHLAIAGSDDRLQWVTRGFSS
ncbi:pentapeptide repeat-containing protein [Nocardia sp. NPDC004068]|uniref:pentapeptide repeat-containing protein n=1 Tax=Nocardia sp. NPDC004068 TaxID=3364303 RepID=UPI0036A074DE